MLISNPRAARWPKSFQLPVGWAPGDTQKCSPKPDPTRPQLASPHPNRSIYHACSQQKPCPFFPFPTPNHDVRRYWITKYLGHAPSHWSGWELGQKHTNMTKGTQDVKRFHDGRISYPTMQLKAPSLLTGTCMSRTVSVTNQKSQKIRHLHCQAFMSIITGWFLKQQLSDGGKVLLFAWDPSGTRKERYYTAFWDRIRRGQVLLFHPLQEAVIKS